MVGPIQADAALGFAKTSLNIQLVRATKAEACDCCGCPFFTNRFDGHVRLRCWHQVHAS